MLNLIKKGSKDMFDRKDISAVVFLKCIIIASNASSGVTLFVEYLV